MLGSYILDVFIGLSFIYFFLSLVCMWIQEFVSWLRQLKGKHFIFLIRNLLDSKPATEKEVIKKATTDLDKKEPNDITKSFFQHPVIQSLFNGKKLPLKITGNDFSTAVLDILKQAGTEGKIAAPVTTEVLKKGVNNTGDEKTCAAITSMIENAEAKAKDDTEKIKIVKEDLISWFNSAKEQASQWYKRKIQISVIIIAIIVSAGFNADTLDMFRTLWNQPVIRDSLSQVATQYVSTDENTKISTGEQVMAIEDKLNNLKSINSLLGWDTWMNGVKQRIAANKNPKDHPLIPIIIFKILGLLITAFGVSQGSSFWYDAIKRLIGLRSGEKPQQSDAAAGS